MTFRPTRAPRGRLVRLGAVLDTRNAPARVREVARMCDGAGLDALWVRDHLSPTDAEPRLEAWTALTLASPDTVRTRMGAMLNIALRSPATLAAMAGTLDAALGGDWSSVCPSDGWNASTSLSGSTSPPPRPVPIGSSTTPGSFEDCWPERRWPSRAPTRWAWLS